VVARKHDEDHVGVVVAQRSQSVKVLLPCRVPQGELDVFGRVERGWDSRDEVLKHGGDVGLRSVRVSEALISGVMLKI
jgi:hypothetical protein